MQLRLMGAMGMGEAFGRSLTWAIWAVCLAASVPSAGLTCGTTLKPRYSYEVDVWVTANHLGHHVHRHGGRPGLASGVERVPHGREGGQVVPKRIPGLRREHRQIQPLVRRAVGNDVAGQKPSAPSPPAIVCLTGRRALARFHRGRTGRCAPGCRARQTSPEKPARAWWRRKGRRRPHQSEEVAAAGRGGARRVSPGRRPAC